MPAGAPREIVREGEPGIDHGWSRCCRGAYLLGMDPLTGKDHNRRRPPWVVERLQRLCGLYVDLNPIRAGEVRTPEAALPTSAFFSLRTRSVALSLNELLETVRQFPRCFRRWAGSVSHFTARAAQVGRRGLHGVRHASFVAAHVAAG